MEECSKLLSRPTVGKRIYYAKEVKYTYGFTPLTFELIYYKNGVLSF